MSQFSVKRADDLMDEQFTAKWRDRQALDPLPRVALRAILGQFVASGAPVKIDELVAQLLLHDPADVRRAVSQLDEKDLIVVQDGAVVLAYPFSATATAFAVVFPDGRERYAVCAIDALGIAPMLGHPVTIRSRCYHCQEPLELLVRPEGPAGGEGFMVWVGERTAFRQKACDSLCRTLNFFRSEDHVAAWWAARPGAPGAAAELGEAFRSGARIFGGLLREILDQAVGRWESTLSQHRVTVYWSPT